MDLADELRPHVHALGPSGEGLEPLFERIGDARVVLLGEATHGTHEFYALRAAITKRLILEKGFCALAWEADFPDAYRVNRFVRGRRGDADALDALGGFQRFPAWMWRNADVLELVAWLREHNDTAPSTGGRAAGVGVRVGVGVGVGVYGLDLYSLHASIAEVVRLLERIDPEAAIRARERYSCFDYYGDPQAYGYAAGLGLSDSCEAQAVAALADLRARAADLIKADGAELEESLFEIEQNARVVLGAEEYYRNMIGGVSTWNLRDTHMTETLQALLTFLERRTPHAKIVVWEHNSHLGDARATSMGDEGEHNVGQLVRERFRDDAVLVGFTTYDGTVTAASDWDGPAEQKRVRPAIDGSYEKLFHEVGLARFLAILDHGAPATELLSAPMLERAIGVVYRPQTERFSHYFRARMAEQFDAIVHVDRTRAVEPLERAGRVANEEPPETFPFGL